MFKSPLTKEEKDMRRLFFAAILLLPGCAATDQSLANPDTVSPSQSVLPQWLSQAGTDSMFFFSNLLDQKDAPQLPAWTW
jgi:hypothetical protein